MAVDLIDCRLNKIDFEEVTVNLAKGQHRTPEFKSKRYSPLLLLPFHLSVSP
jgi:hypothetical protein